MAPSFWPEYLEGWCCHDLPLRKVAAGAEFESGHANSQASLRPPSGDVRHTAGFRSLEAGRSPETQELLLVPSLLLLWEPWSSVLGLLFSSRTICLSGSSNCKALSTFSVPRAPIDAMVGALATILVFEDIGHALGLEEP